MNTTSRENASKSDDRIDKLANQISTLVDIFAKKIVTSAPVNAFEESCVTCGRAHAYYNCPNTDNNEPSVCAATGTYNQVAPQNHASNYMAPPGFALLKNNQNRFNQNQEQGNNFNRRNNFQPFQVPNQGFQNQHFQVPNNPNQSSTSGTLSSNTITNPKGEMKAIIARSGVAYEGPSIPTPKKVGERETDETTDKEQSNFQGGTAHIQPPLREKATNQMEKFFQIFKDLHFDISFADALLLMPKFASTIKSLLTNKDKLFELAKILLNENYSAMLLKKLLEKLGDPGKFLIPCDFSGMDVCHALADLGASINLMPLSIWKKLSLPELTPTQMTLELADRSITHPKGVAEDVFVKVGKFHFSTDFVVVDFEADPRVPVILGRSFLRTGRALIEFYREEITLRVNNEVVTFNLNQTTRYSSTYDDLSVNQIDIIDVAREEYAQKIHGFSNNSSSGNPTSTFEPILFDSSLSLTPFKRSDFILEEIDAYHKDESVSLEINHVDCDPEGDICLIEKLLNDDPFQLPLMDLKQGEVIKAKSLIEKPLEIELKELPSHLEYAYLEGVDKLPVIISKYLKVDEKEALLKVLKSHKRAIAWKIIDIKGIDPRFYKPVVPWVSPIHCVPKKGGLTVVEDENNELIPTWLVTGWRVCIDYRKLNDATRKDHFPLPFMDQMLERLAGNEFYCFLDRFSGYFQILINPSNQEKTTFTGPYGTFAYRIMPFGLCNAHFSKIARRITHLLEKETPFVFSKDCIDAFENLKKKLTEAPILVVPDWNLPFKLMWNFLVKGMSSQQKKKFFKDVKLYFWDDPYLFEYVRIKLFKGVCMAKKLMISSTIVMAIMVPISSPRKAIISNRGTYFRNDKFVKVMFKCGPTHRLATAYHPQISGQVEVSNRELLIRHPLGVLLTKLVYGKSCHLPIELEHKAYRALKHVNFYLKTGGDHWKLQLNELRDQAYENYLIYKDKTKKHHDSKIQNRIFNVGDRVLLFNSRLKILSRNLKTRWSGPFTITKVFPYGTVELSQSNGPNFRVNGHRVKHYFGGDVPRLVVSDLQTFPMEK
nr:reverse transcriptase domain-containing protein [Tanacetum cinerariifolium]